MVMNKIKHIGFLYFVALVKLSTIKWQMGIYEALMKSHHTM